MTCSTLEEGVLKRRANSPLERKTENGKRQRRQLLTLRQLKPHLSPPPHNLSFFCSISLSLSLGQVQTVPQTGHRLPERDAAAYLHIGTWCRTVACCCCCCWTHGMSCQIYCTWTARSCDRFVCTEDEAVCRRLTFVPFPQGQKGGFLVGWISLSLSLSHI